ncbi:MAG: protein translocase subunit SecD, partial [Spirochaetota bacterium]|nr:protein translocase subunit SecD [Spirochaetota bacterium]
MEKKSSRTILVILILALCAYLLYPSVKWHAFTSDAEKKSLDLTSIELAERKKIYNRNMAKLRKMVPIRRHKRKEGGEYLFNIRPNFSEREKYVLKAKTLDETAKWIFKEQYHSMKEEFFTLAKETIKVDDEINKSREFKKLRNSIVVLGLDLAGGSHITVAVDRLDLVKKLRKSYEHMGLTNKNNLSKEAESGKVDDSDKLIINNALLSKYIRNLDTGKAEATIQNDIKQKLDTIKDDYAKDLKKSLNEARENALEIIRNRISNFAIKEMKISRGLGDTIYIELPRLNKKDVEFTVKAFTEAGVLNFHIVDEKLMNSQTGTIPRKYFLQSGEHRHQLIDPIYVEEGQIPEKLDINTFEEDVLDKLATAGDKKTVLNYYQKNEKSYSLKAGLGKKDHDKLFNIFKSIHYRTFDQPVFVPEAYNDLRARGIVMTTAKDGSNLYPYQETDEFGNQVIVGYHVLKNIVQVSGSLLDNAKEDYDQYGTPEVDFTFKTSGAIKFAEVTEKNIKKRLAIVLDGKVKSDPVIQSKIGGQGRITLGQNPSPEEIKKLVAVLKAGALPAKLLVTNQVTIGPSLGVENRNAGLKAVAFGFAAVMLFMLVYYKLAGLIAIQALILNLFLLFSVLASFGFALTLPGIAGIILTIGMAVDANVIIFERMKEEISLGKTRPAVISGAYSKAFS